MNGSRPLAIGALLLGLVLLVLCALTLRYDRQQFYVSYLIAFLFWNGLTQGGMAVVMLHQLTGGGWGESIRRPLLAMTRISPLLALLFIPLVFGMQDLYVWTRPEVVAHDPILQQKTWYLNEPFFFGRAVVYFAIRIVLALTLLRWYGQDKDSRWPSRRLQCLSAGGLILYALIETFAAFDWIMSLTPKWYSTTFGLLVGIGQMLSGFSLAIAIVTLLSLHGQASAAEPPQRFHDLGNLLLMFVMVWMYLAFTQYLIVWLEDLPLDHGWFLPRAKTDWQRLALFLILFQFVLPFCILLSRRAKRSTRVLGTLAAVIVMVHWLEVFWLVAPTFRARGIEADWTDIGLTLSLGGFWLTLLVGQFTPDKTTAKPFKALHQHG